MSAEQLHGGVRERKGLGCVFESGSAAEISGLFLGECIPGNIRRRAPEFPLACDHRVLEMGGVLLFTDEEMPSGANTAVQRPVTGGIPSVPARPLSKIIALRKTFDSPNTLNTMLTLNLSYNLFF